MMDTKIIVTGLSSGDAEMRNLFKILLQEMDAVDFESFLKEYEKEKRKTKFKKDINGIVERLKGKFNL